MAAKEGISCCYGTTLAKDPTCTVASSWTTTDPSTFLIHGKTYLMDSQKYLGLGGVNMSSLKKDRIPWRYQMCRVYNNLIMRCDDNEEARKIVAKGYMRDLGVVEALLPNLDVAD